MHWCRNFRLRGSAQRQWVADEGEHYWGAERHCGRQFQYRGTGVQYLLHGCHGTEHGVQTYTERIAVKRTQKALWYSLLRNTRRAWQVMRRCPRGSEGIFSWHTSVARRG